MVGVTLVPEGPLDEAVARRILADYNREYRVTDVLLERPGRRAGAAAAGRDTLRINLKAYLQASVTYPCIVLVDLEHECACARELLSLWGMPERLGPNFLVQVAVPSVEAWLIAD